MPSWFVLSLPLLAYAQATTTAQHPAHLDTHHLPPLPASLATAPPTTVLLQTQSTLSQSQRIHKSNPYSAAELTLAAARLDQQEQGLPDTPPTTPDVPTVDSTDVEDKSENISFFNASGDPIVLDHAGDPTSDAMVLTPKEHGLTFVQDCLALVANRTRHWKQQQVIRRAFAAIKQEDSDLIKYALEEKRLTDNRDDSYDQLMEDRKQCMNRLNVWRADQIQQERDAYSAKEQKLNTTMVKVRRDADYLALDERSKEDDSEAAAATGTSCIMAGPACAPTIQRGTSLA